MKRTLSLLLMAASGFAGLGYQIVWTQQAALWMGHESAAVLAVVTAFFGGLALGALALAPRIERSPHPLRWYAACEAAIGLWGLVLLVLMAPFSGWVLQLTGTQPAPAWQWALAFCASFVLLLPATVAMGATLPAMERVAAPEGAGRSIAAHYASNTFGAVLGVLASAFWLVPAFGLARTAGVCIALNLACAVAALAVLAPKPVAELPPRTPEAGGLLARLALTGLLGIGYEVLVVRVLSQVAEDTVYTFAMLLAVYLVGSALGAAAYQRWRERLGDPQRLGDRLLCALALACLIGGASLWGAESLRTALADTLGALKANGMAGAVGAEALLALAAFGLPTLVMGALFSRLSDQARAAGVAYGRSLAANTLGAAAAPLLFGVLLAPAFGAKAVLVTLVLGYLALLAKRAWWPLTARVPLALAALAVAVLAFAPPLVFVDVPEGGRVVSYAEGVAAAVSVVEDGDGVSRLRIDNRQQEGSSASGWFDARQALLPLLLHPAPKRALFLGLGTGVTASTAAEDPGVQVDAVELLPEVIAASRHFRPAGDDAVPMPRLNLVSADARRYVRASTQRYELIVSDNFHPARSGSGALYTVEHFEAVRARLAPGGLFCQWLPLHQLDLVTLRSIVQSFLRAYPGATALLASNSLETPVLGLIGRADAGLPTMAAVRERLRSTALPNGGAAAFGIEDEFALLGSFVAGPAALRRFAGDAEANTDDHPVVAYRAPRITYAPDSRPGDRLMALLGELSVDPAEIVAPQADAAVGTGHPADLARLAAYWRARGRFLEAGRGVRASADAAGMLAQVREPLLAVLRISPDFRPAHDPLLRMAEALQRSDPIAARELLEALAKLQPAR